MGQFFAPMGSMGLREPHLDTVERCLRYLKEAPT